MNADLDLLFKELAQSCPEIWESMGKLWNLMPWYSQTLSMVGILGLRLHLVILHVLEHWPSHVSLFREHVKGHVCHRLDSVRLLALRAETSTSALAAAGLSSGINLQLLQEFWDWLKYCNQTQLHTTTMTSRFKHFQTFSSGLSGSSDLVLLAICQLRRLNETIALVPSPGNPTRQRFPHHPPRGTWSMHGESGSFASSPKIHHKCSMYKYMYSIAFFQPIKKTLKHIKIPCVFVFFKIIPGEQRIQSSKVESKETPNHQSRKSFWVIQSCLFWLSMQLLPELRSVQHTNCDSTARKLTIPRITSLEESESQSANTQLQEPSKGREWAKMLKSDEMKWVKRVRHVQKANSWGATSCIPTGTAPLGQQEMR